MARVSKGELDARLPVGARDDQLDRVSVRINANLDHLATNVALLQSATSAIAHELKTPLSQVQIVLNGAANATEIGEDLGPAINTALVGTERLNGISDTILRISRIQATPDRRTFAPVDLFEIAENVVTFLTPAAEEKKRKIKLTEQTTHVFGDRTMLQQVVVNLIQNACTHGGEGTEITVCIAQIDAGPILEVADLDPGISPEVLDRVTKPYMRAEAARSQPGNGLGLALVVAVAERHLAALILRNTNPGLSVSLVFSDVTNS